MNRYSHVENECASDEIAMFLAGAGAVRCRRARETQGSKYSKETIPNFQSSPWPEGFVSYPPSDLDIKRRVHNT